MTWSVFTAHRNGSRIFEVRDKRDALVVEVVPVSSAAKDVEEALQRAKLLAGAPEMFGALAGLLTARDARVESGEIPKAMRNGRDGRYVPARKALEKVSGR